MDRVRPADLLVVLGGEAFEKWGTLVRRTAPASRGGEEWKEVWSRADAATVASYVDRDGYIRRALANVPRVTWPLVGGVRQAHLVVEPPRTSVAAQSEALGGINWGGTVRSSVTSNADSAPDGTTNADRLVEDGTASSTHYQPTTGKTITADAEIVWGVHAKPGPRTWFKLEVANGANLFRRYFNLATAAQGTASAAGSGTFLASGVEGPLADGSYFYWISGTVGGGLTAATGHLFLATGDGVDSYSGDGSSYATFWGAQFEAGARYPSSYMRVTGTSVTRAQDDAYVPFLRTPAPLTFYVRFREIGTGLEGASGMLFHVGSGTASATPRLQCYAEAANRWRFDHVQASTVLSQIAAGAPDPVYGDVMEVRCVLHQDGSVLISQAINEGTENSADQSGPLALPVAWAGERLYLGSRGGSTNPGLTQIRSLKVAGGVYSLAALRAA